MEQTSLSCGKPLYQPTNDLADMTFGRFSPGMPNVLLAEAP